MTSTTQSTGWDRLMSLAQQGQQEAYMQLLTEVSKYAQAIIGQKVRQPQNAEEVLQDCLMSIHRARHSYDPDRPFKPWLNAVIESRVIEYWRKNKKHSENKAPLEDLDPFLEAELEVSALDLETLNRAFASIPDNQAQIIKLLKIEGLSIKQVAQQLEMSESAVKVAAHRGYKVIKTYLKENI